MVKGSKKRWRKVNRMLKRSKNMLKRSKKLLKGSKILLKGSKILVEGSKILVEGSKILLEGSKKSWSEVEKSWSEVKKMLKGKWHLRAFVCILEYAYFIHIGGIHDMVTDMPLLWHFWSFKTDFVYWKIAQKYWTIYQIIFLFNNYYNNKMNSKKSLVQHFRNPEFLLQYTYCISNNY